MFAVSSENLARLLEDTLARGAPLRFEAAGWSMTPFIRDGDAITISALGESAPRPGDVVAFALPGSRPLLVHRIVAEDSGGFLLRGDNSPSPDGMISLADIYGRVSVVERGGKRRRLGFGPERSLIAWLSRSGILYRLIAVAAAARKFLRK